MHTHTQVFQLRIKAVRGAETLQGSLHLVDLTGSERLAKSNATGERLKETCNINKSLSCLGGVFTAIAKKQQHVPFRDSKLTFLLQDSLSRHAKVLMFVNISPAESNASETICSLAFASRCRDVALGAASNKPDAIELAKAKQEIRALKAKLAAAAPAKGR